MLKARSLRNKSTEFQDFVLDHYLDIVCVCETWLTSNEEAVIADFLPEGFTFKHQTRATGWGGGVGVLFHNNLKVNIHTFDALRVLR